MNDIERLKHYQKKKNPLKLFWIVVNFLPNQYRLLKHEFLSVEWFNPLIADYSLFFKWNFILNVFQNKTEKVSVAGFL